MPASTFSSFSRFMGDSQVALKGAKQQKLEKSPNELAREKAMSDMDMFIRK